MDSIKNNYKDFFTFQDADIPGNIIQVSIFSNNKKITPELFSSDNSELTTFILKRGSKWADLLFTGWPGLYLASERVRDVLIEATGVKFHPINILDNKLCDINVNYYRIQVLGKSGPLIKELSREEVTTRIVGGPEFIKKVGLYFTPGSWDGSDFFTPENTLNVFATSKIKNLVNKYKLTNVKMESITEVEMF